MDSEPAVIIIVILFLVIVGVITWPVIVGKDEGDS